MPAIRTQRSEEHGPAPAFALRVYGGQESRTLPKPVTITTNVSVEWQRRLSSLTNGSRSEMPSVRTVAESGVGKIAPPDDQKSTSGTH